MTPRTPILRTPVTVAAIAALTVLGCNSYQVPTSTVVTTLNLDRDDVDLLEEVAGDDWAFGLFPFWMFAPAHERAVQYAVGRATSVAYEHLGADFLLQPRTKAVYFNALLFDFATAEATGKGARIR